MVVRVLVWISWLHGGWGRTTHPDTNHVRGKGYASFDPAPDSWMEMKVYCKHGCFLERFQCRIVQLAPF